MADVKRLLALRKTLARRVRSLRKQNGLTQEQLAERTGLAVRHVQKIEACEVNATLMTLAVLAAALHVTPSLLISPEQDLV